MDYLWPTPKCARRAVASRGQAKELRLVQHRVYTRSPGRVYDDKQRCCGSNAASSRRTADRLAGRAQPERFWVMLMNQTHASRTVTVHLDGAKIGLKPGDGVLYEGNADPFRAAEPAAPAARPWRTTPLRDDRAALPGDRRYPAEARAPSPGQPLAEAHRTADAGEFGKAHAFAIRSPWAKDALYACSPPIRSRRPARRSRARSLPHLHPFPYEASFYPSATLARRCASS
jgi:hypothetical protein